MSDYNPVAKLVDEIQTVHPELSKQDIIEVIRVLLDELEESVAFKEWKDMNIDDLE